MPTQQPAIAGAGSPGPRTYKRPAGLLALWRLGDSATGVFRDEINRYDATTAGSPAAAGAALAYDTTNGATTFDGTNDKGDIATAAEPKFDFERTSAFTLECLIKPNVTRSGATTNYVIYAKASASSPFPGITLALEWSSVATQTRVRVFIIANISSNGIQVVGSTDLQNATTYHVLITYSGSSAGSGVKMYVNGVAETPTIAQNSLSTSILNNVNPTLGAQNTGQWCKADLDELALYTVALTQSDAYYLAAQALRVPTQRGSSYPVPILVSSDYCSDVGDPAAIDCLAGYANAGDARIIAALTDAANAYSAPALKAHLVYRGLSSVPVGAYQGSTPSGAAATSDFTLEIRDRFRPASETRADYDTPTIVGRTALVAEADGSVVVCSLGFATAIRELLDSAADGISGLTGVQLIAAKVKQLVVMGCTLTSGGVLTTGNEYNIVQDPANWNYINANWPTPIVYVGDEVGATIFTGPPSGHDPLVSPVKYAFELGFTSPAGQRASWDQCAVLYAVQGASSYYREANSGTMTINSGTGANLWSGAAGGHSWLIKLAPDAAFETAFDGLLAR